MCCVCSSGRERATLSRLGCRVVAAGSVGDLLQMPAAIVQPDRWLVILDANYLMKLTVSSVSGWVLGAGCRMLDAGCRMQDAGCRMLDAGCRMLDAGCWMLDAGCCSMFMLRTHFLGILWVVNVFGSLGHLCRLGSHRRSAAPLRRCRWHVFGRGSVGSAPLGRGRGLG